MKKLLLLGAFIFLTPLLAHAAMYPDGCTATTKYSATTGHLCVLQTCQPGDLYDSQTGQPCAVSVLPAGCTTETVFSPLTGKKCSDPNISIDNGQPVQRTQTTTPQAVVQPNTSAIQQQINDLQQQIAQLRATAQAQEQAYITGMGSDRGQALAQQIQYKEQSDEAPLLAQIAQLQSQL